MAKNKAKLIIFTGPSGVGKGTILADFFKKVDNNIVYSISNTTRNPRDGEINGMHYFFISKEEFEKLSLELKVGLSNKKSVYQIAAELPFDIILQTIYKYIRNGQIPVKRVD